MPDEEQQEQQDQHSAIFDNLPIFRIDRGDGTIEIEPCPDGETVWHWTYRRHDPQPVKVAVGQNLMTGEYVYEDRVPESQTSHIEVRALVTCLSPDELRLMLGWIDHLNEHMTTHINELVTAALPLALEERRFEGLATASEELVSVCRMQKLANETGRQLLELI